MWGSKDKHDSHTFVVLRDLFCVDKPVVFLAGKDDEEEKGLTDRQSLAQTEPTILGCDLIEQMTQVLTSARRKR